MAEIQFEKVSLGYQKKELLKDIDLSVDKGKITALIGPNGAGKSTILKAAAGLLDPMKGRILIKGKELQEYKSSDLARIMSVMLTEKVASDYETCFDVVRVGRFQYTDMFGRLTKEDKEAIDRAMEMIGVKNLAGRLFKSLSDGQKQRVLLARAIVSDPQILILDEPTSFLDMGYKTEFFDVLKAYVAEREACVLISMHEIELVKKVADVAVSITHDNKLEKCGNPGDILTPEYLEQLFSMSSGKYKEYYE
ncbi:ABC transporter ATP-binding protein [Butyrivibrio sp. FCS014]|uniref:ABC transporter ATP-binding protein n=1 Tax=Butyrivibrio sp. FCS014 TaxID=1408304 RepID=UPI0004657FFE|nr:ABC transporter ATP-binding protein [Butyrivibrio sp. FCS014]